MESKELHPQSKVLFYPFHRLWIESNFFFQLDLLFFLKKVHQCYLFKHHLLCLDLRNYIYFLNLTEKTRKNTFCIYLYQLSHNTNNMVFSMINFCHHLHIKNHLVSLSWFHHPNKFLSYTSSLQEQIHHHYSKMYI